MRKFCNPEMSIIYRLFLFLVVLTCGLILTYVSFMAIVFMLSGFDSGMLNERMAGWNASVSLLRIMQTLQSFLVFILPPFILTRLYKENPKTFLHLKKPALTPTVIGMLSIVFMVPLINALVSWNAGLHLPNSLQGLEAWMIESEKNAENITKLMMRGTSGLDLAINLLIIGAMAGLGEEFLFRGLLQSLFLKEIGPTTGKKPNWAMHTTIWITAFLFSAIHLQFYGFIPRMLLGAWFGYLLWWTGSIWVPVLAHFTNNAISTMTAYSQNKGFITGDPDQLGLNNTWWLCLFSVVMLAACIFYLKQGKKDHGSQL